VTWRGSLLAAALATLAHPRWWILALAGFLVRGGIVLVLLPIVVLPTVAGVMSLLAPTIVGEVIVGGPNSPVAAVAGILTATLVLFAWVAGTLGAELDVALVREAASDEDLGLDVAVPEHVPSGLGTARLGPHLLTSFVFALAAVRIFQVVYAEATSPGAPTTPFVLRVAAQTPLQLGALLGALLLAEAIGGLALRAGLLDPALGPVGFPRAMARALRGLVRPRTIATWVVTTVVVAVIGLPGGLAAGRALSQVRLVFSEPATALAMAIALLLFVAVVLGWLTLLGVALAWRSAAWTAVAVTTVRATGPTVTRPSSPASEASR
jgi:hypothetical protein